MKGLWALAAALLAAALFFAAPVSPGQDRSVVLSASCGASCEPAPRAFAVPEGRKAKTFRLVSLGPGSACVAKGPQRLAGFSIRRGKETVLVYYEGPQGTVSDPLPLADLVLGPGAYELLVVPARGASVTLSYQLEDAQ